MLHIIHNSTVDFGHSMPRFSEVVNQLSHLCKFLRKRDTKQRLLEACFQDAVGRHLQAELRAFSAKLHTGRWGSIAECVRQVLEVESSLRYGWDLAKYGNVRPRQAGENEPSWTVPSHIHFLGLFAHVAASHTHGPVRSGLV